MINRASTIRSVRFSLMTMAALLMMPATSGLAETGPFAPLGGAWSGSGNILTRDGASERIRCRATNTIAGGGSGLKQVLQCASDSYRFDLTTNVRASGTALSGDWSETSRNVNGTVSGQIRGGKIDAVVEGNGFAASLNMQTSGDRQTIAINSQNTELRGINITLSR